MLVAIGGVTTLAWWDSRRESDAILGDVASEQALLATVLAANLRARRLTRAGSPPREPEALAKDFFGELPDAASAGDERVFLSAPNEAWLYATPGRPLPASGPTSGIGALRGAVERGLPTLRLTRPQAADLGLVERTAMAAIEYVDAGSGGGRWAVAAVGTAARPRDRESRALGRLVVGVGLASLLVVGFGGVALRNLRSELDLERELAVAQVLRERDEQLAQAERIATMGTFAMGVVHEVATPLGVIMGRVEQLALRASLDERGAQAVQVILNQVDRIQQIVHRFLDMARGGPPSLAETPPADIVSAAAALVEHRFENAGVHLATDTPNGMPEVQCDRGLLEQAIVNLLLNACDACPRGGHVELTAREDGARVAFVVTDDGIGITPEEAARAVEPFFTTKPAAAGTGVGLAIASEIAKSHRGELSIVRNGTRGTRACIQIPVTNRGGRDAVQ